MSAERKPLLGSGEVGNTRTRKENSQSSCGYFILVPVLFLFFFGEESIKYELNEWTQYYIKLQYFPSESFRKNQTVCENKDGSQTVSEDYKKVQQQTSHWLLYFKIAEYVPTLLSAFVLPSYSDAIGRRMLLFLAGLGCFVKAAIAAISIFFKLPLYWIVIGYAVEGIAGGAEGYLCMCFSYVADITGTNSHRVFAITVIKTVVMLASTCGGFVTGFMVESDRIGYKYTAITCAALIASSFLLALCFLRESLPKEKRTTVKPFFVTMKRTFDFCFSIEFKGKRKYYIILLLSFAFSRLGESNRSGLETMYFLGQPFCWDPIRIGYFSFARHASKGIIGIGILKVMQLCLSSEAIAILSTLSNLSSYIIEAIAKSSVLVYMATVSGVLTMLAEPMIRGIISTMTPPDKQGSLFASVTVVETASEMISIATQNLVYSATVSVMNGFVFFVMAGFCLVACLLLILFKCLKSNLEHSVAYEKINDAP